MWEATSSVGPEWSHKKSKSGVEVEMQTHKTHINSKPTIVVVVPSPYHYCTHVGAWASLLVFVCQHDSPSVNFLPAPLSSPYVCHLLPTHWTLFFTYTHVNKCILIVDNAYTVEEDCVAGSWEKIVVTFGVPFLLLLSLRGSRSPFCCSHAFIFINWTFYSISYVIQHILLVFWLLAYFSQE